MSLLQWWRARQNIDRVTPRATPEALGKAGFEEDALPLLDAVYRFALRLTRGDSAEAEELVQETFLRAYRSWETFTRGTGCHSWLFTICRNAFNRTLEQKIRSPEWGGEQISPAAEALAATVAYNDVRTYNPEQTFFRSFMDAEVTRAIDALPEAFREVVVMSDIEGLSYGEIAAVLGVPNGTVKSRIYRGRRLLQESLYKYAVEMGYLHVRTQEKE